MRVSACSVDGVGVDLVPTTKFPEYSHYKSHYFIEQEKDLVKRAQEEYSKTNAVGDCQYRSG
jgi:hypothetical protein